MGGRSHASPYPRFGLPSRNFGAESSRLGELDRLLSGRKWSKSSPVSHKLDCKTLKSIPNSATMNRISPHFYALSGRNCPCEHLRTSANTKNEQNPHHHYIEIKTQMKAKNTSGRCFTGDRHFLMRRGHNEQNATMNRQSALFGRLIFSQNIYHYI